MHQGRRSRWLALRPDVLTEMSDYFRHNTYVRILYLRHANTMLAIMCTGLPITTTTAGERLNSLIFHDNITCIASTL